MGAQNLSRICMDELESDGSNPMNPNYNNNKNETKPESFELLDKLKK